MTTVSGVHHITAIAGDPQQTVDFYVGVLGLRLVKKSINQDVPDTYHLFFADGDGHPGTDLTFFPWPSMGAGRIGAGVWGEVSFVVPPESLDWWEQRLRRYGVSLDAREERFGEGVIPFADPFGMRLALVGTAVYHDQPSTAWDRSTVPAEHQIRALGGARITALAEEPTARFLATAFGFSRAGEQDGWIRYSVGEGVGGQRIDIRVDRGAAPGGWGVGSVHHVAFRVPDDEAEATVRQQVIGAGGRPTGFVDRFWFKSVYVNEPGGALCEIATDGPGFAVDEEPHALGETLVLPPWYEPQRARIEAVLPPIRLPQPSGG